MRLTLNAAHNTKPEAEQVEDPSDEIVLTLQNLSDLSIKSPKAGARDIEGPPFLQPPQKSFLKRCEAEGIPTKGEDGSAGNNLRVSHAMFRKHPKSTVKRWGCPL